MWLGFYTNRRQLTEPLFLSTSLYEFSHFIRLLMEMFSGGVKRTFQLWASYVVTMWMTVIVHTIWVGQKTVPLIWLGSDSNLFYYYNLNGYCPLINRGRLIRGWSTPAQLCTLIGIEPLWWLERLHLVNWLRWPYTFMYLPFLIFCW